MKKRLVENFVILFSDESQKMSCVQDILLQLHGFSSLDVANCTIYLNSDIELSTH